MGLLDDAIREHLELKRQHGADPHEVERQEREALGSAPEGAVAASEQALPPDDVEPGPEPDEPPEDAADEDALPADEPGEPEEPAPGEVAGAPGYDEEPWLEEERPAPAEVAESEDVLEETPEFLQETPEHDRLWFEQKPPRDFDWDS